MYYRRGVTWPVSTLTFTLSIFSTFIFRCLVNCEYEMNVSSRLSLTTTCRGSGCNTATYQWELNSLGSSGTVVRTVALTRDMTETDLSLPGIVIKPHRFGFNRYRLIVTVTPNSGPAGKSAYQFTTNMPPYNGYCNASRYSGQALKTTFYLSCSRWKVKIFGGLHRLLIIQY